MRELLIFWVFGSVLPAVLVGIAWRRYDRVGRTALVVPTLGVVLLVLAIQRDLKWLLLGPDYSQRLYITIEVIMALTVASALYSGIRRRWIALAASVMVILAWLWVGAINSVV